MIIVRYQILYSNIISRKLLIISVIFIIKQIDQKHFTHAMFVIQFNIHLFFILFHNMILSNIKKKIFLIKDVKKLSDLKLYISLLIMLFLIICFYLICTKFIINVIIQT